MNEIESKVTVLYESVIKLLTDDNTNTGKTVREIHHYVADRIYRTYLRQEKKNPKILVDVIENATNFTLPTGKYMLTFTVVVNSDDAYALTVLDNISARVEYLFNRKSSPMNLAFSSKNLRCRMINKVSGITATDGLKRTHSKHIMFDLTLDEENNNL